MLSVPSAGEETLPSTKPVCAPAFHLPHSAGACVSHSSQMHLQHTWSLQPASPRRCFAPCWLLEPCPCHGQAGSGTVALMSLRAPGPQIRRKAKSRDAAELRCQGEAVTGELNQGKQNSSLSPLSAAGGLPSEQCLGTRGSGACSFGTCSP